MARAAGVPIPVDEKNILCHIKKPANPLPNLLADPLGHMYLVEILDALQPAIRAGGSVLIVWSACRQVMLEKMGRLEITKRRVEWDASNASRVRAELAKTGRRLLDLSREPEAMRGWDWLEEKQSLLLNVRDEHGAQIPDFAG